MVDISNKMNTQATGLIEVNGSIIGIKALSENNEIEIKCDLVIAADGRGL